MDMDDPAQRSDLRTCEPGDRTAWRPLLSRRAFAGLLLSAIGTVALAGDLPPRRGAGRRRPPVPVDQPDLARYLDGLGDLPLPVWSLLAVTASVLDPGPNTIRSLTTRLPSAAARSRINGWTFRAEADRMGAILAAAEAVYARLLPPDRAAFHNDLLARERARLAAGAQVDYRSVYYLVTRVNREQGLMARPEIDGLDLVRQHRLDPVSQPRGVGALLAERRERREVAAAFRPEAARLLAGAPIRRFAAPGGPLTLLADLGRPTGAPRGFQVIRANLADLGDETLMAHDVYFTAGEFLAHESAAPPGRWADVLPPEQRAYAPTNALSPRLKRGEIIDPEHASRVLWPPLADCRALVGELRSL